MTRTHTTREEITTPRDGVDFREASGIDPWGCTGSFS